MNVGLTMQPLRVSVRIIILFWQEYRRPQQFGGYLLLLCWKKSSLHDNEIQLIYLPLSVNWFKLCKSIHSNFDLLTAKYIVEVRNKGVRAVHARDWYTAVLINDLLYI